MATEYGQRLLTAMAHAGINQKELVKRTGLSQSTVSSAINRAKGSTDTPAYAAACGVSALWLATGQGTPDTSKIVDLGNFRGKNKPDEFVIPQFETGGAMGGGLLLRDQPGVIKGWSVNQEWVQKNVKSHTGAANLCIVTGFGDSMKGMFNPGDPLLVDRGVVAVDYDAVYFFRVEAEGFIKRLQRIPGEGIRVLSENKKYESWTIKSGMDFEVFGRVLKAWQGEDF
jgi:phage repressor protein C with HTH and peptisase S24 domain